MSDDTFTDSGACVALQRVKPEAMFLRQHVGDGDLNGRKFEITLTSGGSLLVEFDGPRAVYAVAASDLVEAAAEAEDEARMRRVRASMDADDAVARLVTCPECGARPQEDCIETHSRMRLAHCHSSRRTAQP